MAMDKVVTPQRLVNSKQCAQETKSSLTSSPPSSSDEDGYLSPFNGSDDGSPFTGSEGNLLDEMPPFSAYSLSPSARSLSPIELESFESPCKTPQSSKDYIGCSTPVYGGSPLTAQNHHSGTAARHQQQHQQPADGFVTLDEIHARIGLTPPDGNGSRGRLNLETIFEGVFLETPPKKEFQSRTNLFRRSIRNRTLLYESGIQKENMP